MEMTETVDDIPRGRGETILMVEDDPTTLNMGQIILQHLGYEVISAATPGEAIQLAEDPEHNFHLVITDVVMPEMNGRELVEKLQSIRPGILHLFMSGYTSDAIIERGVSDQEENFIQKPFTVQDIANKVRAHLNS